MMANIEKTAEILKKKIVFTQLIIAQRDNAIKEKEIMVHQLEEHRRMIYSMQLETAKKMDELQELDSLRLKMRDMEPTIDQLNVAILRQKEIAEGSNATVKLLNSKIIDQEQKQREMELKYKATVEKYKKTSDLLSKADQTTEAAEAKLKAESSLKLAQLKLRKGWAGFARKLYEILVEHRLATKCHVKTLGILTAEDEKLGQNRRADGGMCDELMDEDGGSDYSDDSETDDKSMVVRTLHGSPTTPSKVRSDAAISAKVSPIGIRTRGISELSSVSDDLGAELEAAVAEMDANESSPDNNRAKIKENSPAMNSIFKKNRRSTPKRIQSSSINHEFAKPKVPDTLIEKSRKINVAANIAKNFDEALEASSPASRNARINSLPVSTQVRKTSRTEAVFTVENKNNGASGSVRSSAGRKLNRAKSDNAIPDWREWRLLFGSFLADTRSVSPIPSSAGSAETEDLSNVLDRAQSPPYEGPSVPMSLTAPQNGRAAVSFPESSLKNCIMDVAESREHEVNASSAIVNNTEGSDCDVASRPSSSGTPSSVDLSADLALTPTPDVIGEDAISEPPAFSSLNKRNARSPVVKRELSDDSNIAPVTRSLRRSSRHNSSVNTSNSDIDLPVLSSPTRRRSARLSSAGDGPGPSKVISPDAPAVADGFKCEIGSPETILDGSNSSEPEPGSYFPELSLSEEEAEPETSGISLPKLVNCEPKREPVADNLSSKAISRTKISSKEFISSSSSDEDHDGNRDSSTKNAVTLFKDLGREKLLPQAANSSPTLTLKAQKTSNNSFVDRIRLKLITTFPGDKNDQQIFPQTSRTQTRTKSISRDSKDVDGDIEVDYATRRSGRMRPTAKRKSEDLAGPITKALKSSEVAESPQHRNDVIPPKSMADQQLVHKRVSRVGKSSEKKAESQVTDFKLTSSPMDTLGEVKPRSDKISLAKSRFPGVHRGSYEDLDKPAVNTTPEEQATVDHTSPVGENRNISVCPVVNSNNKVIINKNQNLSSSDSEGEIGALNIDLGENTSFTTSGNQPSPTVVSTSQVSPRASESLVSPSTASAGSVNDLDEGELVSDSDSESEMRLQIVDDRVSVNSASDVACGSSSSKPSKSEIRRLRRQKKRQQRMESMSANKNETPNVKKNRSIAKQPRVQPKQPSQATAKPIPVGPKLPKLNPLQYAPGILPTKYNKAASPINCRPICCTLDSIGAADPSAVRSATSFLSRMLQHQGVMWEPVTVFQSFRDDPNGRFNFPVLISAIAHCLHTFSSDLLKPLYDTQVAYKPVATPHVGVGDRKLWELLEFLAKDVHWGPGLIDSLLGHLGALLVSDSADSYNQIQETSICRFFAYICEKLDRPRLVLDLLRDLLLIHRDTMVHVLATFVAVKPDLFRPIFPSADAPGAFVCDIPFVSLLRDLIQSLIVRRKPFIRGKIKKAIKSLCPWAMLSDEVPCFTFHFQDVMEELTSKFNTDDQLVIFSAPNNLYSVSDSLKPCLDRLQLISIYADPDWVVSCMIQDLLQSLQGILTNLEAVEGVTLLKMHVIGWLCVTCVRRAPTGDTIVRGQLTDLIKQIIEICSSVLKRAGVSEYVDVLACVAIWCLLDIGPLYPRTVIGSLNAHVTPLVGKLPRNILFKLAEFQQNYDPDHIVKNPVPVKRYRR